MARRFPHRIQIQTATTVTGTDGTEARTFANARERSARLTGIKGSESLLGGRSYPTATHVIEMRYDPKNVLTADDQITHNSVTYDIEYIDNVGERNRETIIFAKSKRT